jgi:predicted Rossmann-fold nucleotide-binding protein
MPRARKDTAKQASEPVTAAGNSEIRLDDEEAVKEVVWSSIQGLWDVVNSLTRLRPTRRERFRVSIFGSARVKPGTFGYEETKRAAAELARMGCDIITGGGPGLMQAANEGAALAPERSRSYGIRVDLPFEQNVNAFVSHAFEHRTFFTRLHQFVLASDAFLVTPGGIGTVLETLMIWQLLQVNHLRGTPLVLVGKMWPGLVDWARSSMLSTEPPLANAKDLEIPVCVASADEAIAIVREHRKGWMAEQRRAVKRKS